MRETTKSLVERFRARRYDMENDASGIVMNRELHGDSTCLSPEETPRDRIRREAGLTLGEASVVFDLALAVFARRLRADEALRLASSDGAAALMATEAEETAAWEAGKIVRFTPRGRS
ncbi:MAG TPA: hypothetical protein PLB02_04130 [Thermoanaerobaculia bacterium]|nr:hypothetical protein [Thermoanaerobaculia bacterium]HQR66560.1 hypothetical protein [Thermoanaerobaculia bacterium]